MPEPARKLPPREIERLKATLKTRAEEYYAWALSTQERRRIAIAKFATEQAILKDEFSYLRGLTQMRMVPPTLDDFLEDKEFLAGEFTLWEPLKDDLRKMNPDVWVGEPPVHEVLLGGATGTGKTTLGQATTMYQAMLLTCFECPQRLWGLHKVTPIIFLLQSVSTTSTRRIVYEPIRKYFTGMPYAKRWVPHDKYRENTLDLVKHNIVIAPVQASLEAMIGYAVIGSVTDEVNFLAIVKQSKKVPGLSGQGGEYNQAREVYNNITRRRKSRFAKRGYSVGVLCVSSSTRYKNDFLDKRIEEVREYQEPNILVFRRKQYEARPASDYSGAKFQVLIGTDEYPTRIIDPKTDIPGVTYPVNATIEQVPVEYKVDFQRDPDAALRDIIGVATDSITPFIRQKHKIIDAIMRWRERGLKSWVEKDEVDLAQDGYPRIVEGNLPRDRAKPRWAHVDLAISGDGCGIAVVKVDGYVNVVSADDPDLVETKPRFVVELAVVIRPNPMHQIDIGEVRGWIMQLAKFHELNLYGVSYDGYQSKESLQAYRKAGVVSREISMDRTMEPYQYLRECFYQDRIDMADVEIARVELSQLEEIVRKKKIDHPPAGSKDAADAICGAVYNAATSRSIRSHVAYADSAGERVRVSRRNLVRPNPKRPAGRPRH